jgi:hypothetical protein
MKKLSLWWLSTQQHNGMIPMIFIWMPFLPNDYVIPLKNLEQTIFVVVPFLQLLRGNVAVI